MGGSLATVFADLLPVAGENQNSLLYYFIRQDLQGRNRIFTSGEFIVGSRQ
ncbi:hypothetical protein ALO_01005 [Acetonema longum DSM 6540]|uniref:Uncharacterized protein n=1 Tax=Acetonema longum DSM 6540 TaxID=1009370 RepID=F7NDU4_9FIRM|nr:hypothetical protein ALO_01005 [Acetonema longum DSM 6540]